MLKKQNLQTGDVLLFTNSEGWGTWLGRMIKWGTHSNWTHSAIILKDPDFINPTLKGLYIWESGLEIAGPDPQDGKHKFGVQIAPLAEIENKGKIFVRRAKNHEKYFTKEKLKEIHSVVYKTPYDYNPLDWIQALLKFDLNPQKTDRFWCSAFVGYIYTQCGLLPEDTDWSILTPNDFDVTSNLPFVEDFPPALEILNI